MGLVLDSSMLIAAEREKRPVSQLLSALSVEDSETEFLLSSISVMELEHGWHRALTPEAVAKMDADMKKVGQVIATADLLIGITALHYSYAIGTCNVRHFKMIPV